MACKRQQFMSHLGHKVPCGRCPDCDKRYINSWVFRLLLEAAAHPADRVTFLTCTYKDEKLPTTTKEAKKSFQLFMKKLRLYSGIKLRYAASLERGEKNGRFHWHVILYGIFYQWEVKQWLEKTWSNGFIDWRPANVKTIRYVLKYVLKSRTAKRTLGNSQPDSALTGCWLMSRRPGLGSTLLPDIAKTLHSLSPKSVAALHGSKNATLTPWKDRPLSALRYGSLLYPMHRYLQERLRVPALVQETVKWIYPEDISPGDAILSTNSISVISTPKRVTENETKK